MHKAEYAPPQILTDEQLGVPELKWVDDFSQVLDTRFRIPGTQQRFGIDFLLGLIPGAGDLLSLSMSGILVATMAQHGASPKLVFRMLVNVLLDALVGSVPILGNIFDLFYKANHRNAVLMREYYDEGQHQGSVWPVVLAVVVAMIVIIGLFAWLAAWVLSLVLGLFQ